MRYIVKGEQFIYTVRGFDMYAWNKNEKFDKLCEDKRNREQFYKIAFSILHNKFDAEDAVQNAYIKLNANFWKYSSKSYDSLLKICKTTVRNEAINILRKQKNEVSFWCEWDEEKIVDTKKDILKEIIRKYEKEQLKEIWVQLEPGEKELLYLRYTENIKPRRIAKLLGISTQKVKNRIGIIKKKVTLILEERGCL